MMAPKPKRQARSLRGTRVLPVQRITFDAYTDMVREAELELLIAAPSTAPWEVGHWEINSLVLQYVAEGGSKILHGISRSDALLFVFQHEKYFANRVIFDGHVAQPYDIAVLPPSSHLAQHLGRTVGFQYHCRPDYLEKLQHELGKVTLNGSREKSASFRFLQK
jgi:hypothetical protein